MRGREPRSIAVGAHDRCLLEQIAHSRTLPWFQVQRARALLAMAVGERVQTEAMQCDPSTVWRLCRRYEQAGLEGVLWRRSAPATRPTFPPLAHAQIVQLAC